MIPLYQVPLFVAYRSSVKGIRPHGFGDITWNAKDWWRER